MIKKKPDGKWLVDVQPGGRGKKRYRKTFPTQGEAKRWENWITRQVIETPEWEPPKKDSRSLQDLVDIWWNSHGRGLKDGKNRYRWLQQIASEMGNPVAHSITGVNFTTWRSMRIDNGASVSTVNNALAYLRALFSELSRIDEWTPANPFGKVRSLPKDETELSYLSLDQIIDLLEACEVSNNPDTRVVAEICLQTGARWSEAESLSSRQVGDHRISFTATKNRKSRTLPISDCLHKKLTTKEGPLFSSCYSAFRKAVDRAGIDLPTGQLSHVLRHTFASHFMMNGGNILVLQKALGHASLQMTMRYAHFSPDHLEEVARLNPLK